MKKRNLEGFNICVTEVCGESFLLQPRFAANQAQAGIPAGQTLQDLWGFVDRELCPPGASELHVRSRDAHRIFPPCFPFSSLTLHSDHTRGSTQPLQVLADWISSEKGTMSQRSKVTCPLSQGHMVISAVGFYFPVKLRQIRGRHSQVSFHSFQLSSNLWPKQGGSTQPS